MSAKVFLEYGINAHGEAYHVSHVYSGITDLHCPYCMGTLIARKGDKVAHHFAHHGETCRESVERAGNIAVPGFHSFNLDLSASDLKMLEDVRKNGTPGYWVEKASNFRELLQQEYVKEAWDGGYELTHKGKIPFGETTLQKFAEIQDWLIREKYQRMEAETRSLMKSQYFQVALADLKLYRAQLRRLLNYSLYFLEINRGQYYKVGVTNRPIEERIDELIPTLRRILGDVRVDVLRVFEGRGAVENYFKFRYQENVTSDLGNLTEYFSFEERRNVLSDLSKMGAKVFTDFDYAILSNDLPDVEKKYQAELQRRARIKEGMQRVKLEIGKHIGRPVGEVETDEEVIQKYPEVVRLLEEQKQRKRWAADPDRYAIRGKVAKLTTREIAKQAKVSPTTVTRVKKALANQEAKNPFRQLRH